MLTYIILWFMIYSFLGWLYESTLYTLLTGVPTNSGFLNGPFCPIYGLGSILGVYLFYDKVDSMVEIFVLAFFIEGTFEFLIGTLLECCFHKKWWDYSELPMNIKGRVCFLSSFVFGVLVVLLIKFIHPFMVIITFAVPKQAIFLVDFMFIYIVVKDIIYTLADIASLNDEPTARYGVICGKLKSTDERLKEFIYSMLSTSKTLREIMDKSRKITDKFNSQDVSRDYVKFQKNTFSDFYFELKEKITEKFLK